MEEITISKEDGMYKVSQGDKIADQLGGEEMIGLIVSLTIPDSKPCVHWLKPN